MGVFDFVFSLIFIIMDHPVISFCVFFVSVVAFVIFVILKKRSAKKYVIPGRVVPFDSVPATNDTSAKVMDDVRVRPVDTSYSDMIYIVHEHSERFNALCIRLKDAGILDELPNPLRICYRNFNSFAQYSRFDFDKFVSKSDRVREWYRRYAVNIKKRGRISGQLPPYSYSADVEKNLFTWGAKGDVHTLCRSYLSIEARECRRLLWGDFDPKKAVIVEAIYTTPARRKSYPSTRTYSLGDLERVLDVPISVKRGSSLAQRKQSFSDVDKPVLSDGDVGIVAKPVLIYPDGQEELDVSNATPVSYAQETPLRCDLDVPTVPPKIDSGTHNNTFVNNNRPFEVEMALQHAESQKFVAPVTHGAQMLRKSGVPVSEKPECDINDLIRRDEAKYAVSEKQMYHPVSLEQKLVPDEVLTRPLDGMDGPEFEEFCANLLRYVGFTNVHTTPHHNDYGVDVVAYWGNDMWLVQCKSYSSRLGNKPVQEVVAGKNVYHGDRLAVMTNSSFTKNAKVVAAASHVALWNGAVLRQMQLGKFNIGVYYR